MSDSDSDSSLDDIIVFAAAMFAVQSARKRSRSITSADIKRRKIEMSLHKYLAMLDDPMQFFNDTQMSSRQFFELLEMVRPNLEISDDSYPVEIRVFVTIRFLATGDSMQTLADLFMIEDVLTCHGIVIEVCVALWNTLSPVYLKAPTSPSEFIEVAKGFEKKFDLPHCVGAVDSKRITIEQPPSESDSCNDDCSVVLLAVCDADYCFTFVDIWAEVSHIDNVEHHDRDLGKRVQNHEFPVPKPEKLPNSEEIFPYFLVGNETFVLTKNFMIPFGKECLKGPEEQVLEKQIFNYRLDRAQRTTENAFGILGSHWRILRHPINCEPKEGPVIIKACVALHNYVMKTKSSGVENPPQGYYGDRYDKTTDYLISKAMWRFEEEVFENIGIISDKNAATDANDHRMLLTKYVNYSLPLPYQRDHVMKVQ